MGELVIATGHIPEASTDFEECKFFCKRCCRGGRDLYGILCWYNDRTGMFESGLGCSGDDKWMDAPDAFTRL